MINELFYKGSFGIERETLRVDSRCRLAQTSHPFEESSNITRDFCESQIELVTPVCSSVDEAIARLEELDSTVREKLDSIGEKVWLYSNPPHFDSEEDIHIANFTGEHSGKRLYREQLEERYGKRVMLFSGVHFNFSFDEKYLETICSGEEFAKWRESFYLKLCKQLSLHSWLLVLLTAASPIYDRSLYEDGAEGAVLGKYASVRSGEKGYWNSFVPLLDFSSVEAYVQSIQRYVESGELFSASEVYLPIRLKPRGVNRIENFKKGISHIELRMLDLNPTTALGVDRNDLEFAHLLMMYLSRQRDFDYTAELQTQAVANHKNSALYKLEGVLIDGVPILDRAEQILDEMSVFFCGDINANEVIAYEKHKLKNRLCERIAESRRCC